MMAIKEWLERHLGIVAFVLVVVILVGVVLVQRSWSRSASNILPSPTLPPSPAPTATPEPIRVHVSGAVLAPDVYVLDADSIVKDAILAAGGATDELRDERCGGGIAAPEVLGLPGAGSAVRWDAGVRGTGGRSLPTPEGAACGLCRRTLQVAGAGGLCGGEHDAMREEPPGGARQEDR